MKNNDSPDAHAIQHPFNASGNTQLTLPTPREFNGKKYYGLADVAKILGLADFYIAKRHPICYNTFYQGRIRSHGWRSVCRPPKEVFVL